MDWNFDFGWMIIGLFLTAGGALMIYKSQLIAEHVFSSTSAIDRIKLWGVIIILVGLAVLANLHTLLLTLIVRIVFKR
jgi:hypothetical protein